MSERFFNSTRDFLMKGIRAGSHDGIHGLITSDITRRGRISGITFRNKPITYTVFSNCALFEGDIILETINKVDNRGRRERAFKSTSAFRTGVGIERERFLWPNRIVPFKIDQNFPLRMRRRIEEAINQFRYRTRLNFYERTDSLAKAYPNYINIKPSRGCWSFVGMRGGRQDIGLVPWCKKSAIIHEIGHTVGLWHEQSREDRDKFVRINYDNIALHCA